MMFQQPLPPVPPTSPAHPFDPNLIFMQHGGSPFVTMIVIAGLAATVIILWPIVRAFARRLEGKGGDPALKAELELLHTRLGEVDVLHNRVAELEDRLDFTERLLAQARDAQGRLLREGETR